MKRSDSRTGASDSRAGRCKAKTRAGTDCGAMGGDDGLCAIHGGRQDPRELGRKGGRVGKGNAAIRKLPARAKLSLRERLRGLDHETVKAACEEILAGGNQTAKVQVIRLLCDLEVYRDNDPDERERQAQIHVAAEEFKRRIDAMAERRRYWRHKQRVERKQSVRR